MVRVNMLPAGSRRAPSCCFICTPAHDLPLEPEGAASEASRSFALPPFGPPPGLASLVMGAEACSWRTLMGRSMAAVRGTWFEKRADGFEVGATTRNPIAVIIVPYGLGIAVALMSSLFSAAAREELGLLPVLAMLAIAVTVASVATAVSLMTICGKVVVCVRGDDALLFQGVWRFGRTLRFRWSELRAVSLVERRARRGPVTHVVLRVASHPRLVELLTLERRDFVVSVLQQMLREYKPSVQD